MKTTEEITILWNQFRSGDEKAFAELFNRFSDPLYRYGVKFIDDKEVVKDCIQDLFIKLHQNRDKISAADNPRLYLFKSLKNKLIDSLRTSDKLVYLPPQELHFSINYYFDPEEENEYETELKEKFEKVICSLTDRQKEAIYLKYQLELSYEEIAQIMNVNYQSARNLIHRSIQKIRSEISLTLFISILVKFSI